VSSDAVSSFHLSALTVVLLQRVGGNVLFADVQKEKIVCGIFNPSVREVSEQLWKVTVSYREFGAA